MAPAMPNRTELLPASARPASPAKAVDVFSDSTEIAITLINATIAKTGLLNVITDLPMKALMPMPWSTLLMVLSRSSRSRRDDDVGS